MTIATTRSALATALRTIDGLTNVSEYLQDQIKPPHAMLDLSVTPHFAFDQGGSPLSTYSFKVYVYANRTADESSQKFLDKMRDPEDSGSVFRVLMDNATLASTCPYVTVTGGSETQVSGSGTNAEYLLVVFDVEVVL